jgi:aerobic carbon-monoxide dehydrogenase medium subunit
MYPANFAYHKASSFEQASQQLVGLGEDAKAIAGGQTLIPMMKLRLLRPGALVDLSPIPEANDIAEKAHTIEIGALTRHDVIASSDVAARYPILRDCAAGIADVQVRNMGTIGGSLAEADPNSCLPTLLVALDARVECVGPTGRREQSVRALLADAYTPNLDHGELITRVVIDSASLVGFGSFVAFKRSAPSYPTASCALIVHYQGDEMRTAVMGFGCMGLTPLVFDATEFAQGRALEPSLIQQIGEAAAASVEPLTDNKGSSDYKRALLKGLVRRAFDNVECRRKGNSVKRTHFYYG